MEETDYIEQCFREEDLTATDRENLKALILSKSFKRAVRICLEGMNGMQQQLVGADLTTPQGIGVAQQTQGKAQGIQFVLSELFALATEEPETEEEEETEDGGDE